MTDFTRRLLLPYPVWAPEGEGGGDAAAVVEEVIDEGADTVAADLAPEEKVDTVTAEDPKADAVAEGVDDTEADEGADKALSVALSDDLRDAAAGEDKELRKLLGRYTSIKTLAQALKNAQAKIASGPARKSMPDPKDEKAMAEWRKAEGVPDDPAGYELPETVKTRLTDEDKPVLASFTEYAHQKGASPATVAIATEWYVDMVESQQAARIEQDREASSTAEEALRADMGPEYKANLRLGAGYMESIPGVGKDWTEARLPNGRRLGDIPEFVTWAVEQGRREFGDPVFATADSVERHTNRVAEIEKIRDTDFDRYEREGLDKELLQLRQKDMARGRAA